MARHKPEPPPEPEPPERSRRLRRHREEPPEPIPPPEQVEAAAAAFQRYLGNLSKQVEGYVTHSFRGLPDLSENTAWNWAARTLQFMERNQALVGGATTGYLTVVTGSLPPTLPASLFTTFALRNIEGNELWTRPPRVAWQALHEGKSFPEAMKLGAQRAGHIAVSNIQLSHTHAYRHTTRYVIGAAAGATVGHFVREHRRAQQLAKALETYRRRTRPGACELCVSAGHGGPYRSENLMPIHQGCHCVVVPAGRRDPGPQNPPPPEDTNVAVREHDELGPVLTDADDDFSPPHPPSDPERIEQQAAAVAEAGGGA